MRPLLFLLLAGCGVSTLEVGPHEGRDAADAELQAARCAPYPWAVNTGPSGEADARKELSSLSATATMSWSAMRNTPASINTAEFALDCPDGKDALETLFDFVQAHPALFRIDVAEWARHPMPCEALGQEGAWFNTGRLSYAGRPARSDVFAFRVRREKTTLFVEAIGGSWIPPAAYADSLALRRCGSLDMKAADATVRRSRLHYTVFDWCVAQGDYDYLAQPADTFDVDADAAFEWSDQSGAVVLRKVHRARLVLDASSYTPNLLSSDANCPKPGGIPYVGFELGLDSVTGELLEQKPGLGCIVCLAP